MISGIVLTSNNATTIERCLESLTWCDEIIVIDDNSTDDTKKIAEKKGATVYLHQLNKNFAEQRNFGLKKAKEEWVLFLDSDEIVTKKLAKEIQEVINHIDAQGFYLKRRDVLFGTQLQFGETANVRLLRLGKKDAGIWKRRVHETWDIQGTVGTLVHPLLHYPHQTMTEFIADINAYSTLHAEELYKEGKKVNAWEIVMYPLGKFLQNYFWRQGFRDGTPGAILAMMMSLHSFLARGKLYLKYKHK